MPQRKPPDRWSRLSENEKSFIKERLHSSRSMKASPISPRPKGSKIPLSSAQERLWFLDQLEPDTPIYNRPWALRLQGQLNFQVLEKCLNEVVLRHESLRTTFPEINGQPYQVVQPFSESTLPVVDLRDLPIEERESRAVQLSREETRCPFDLTQDRMFRPCLIQLDETDHILLLTTHHISFDGWSETILFNELAKLYTAFSADQPSPLPKPRIQYPDHAYWESHHMQESDLNRLTSFWKEELRGAPHLLELRTDRPRPNKLTHKGASQAIQISNEFAQSIKDFSQAQGTTLFMTLLSAFNIVVFLNSGVTDIILGTPVAGRKFVELEEIIGFFVNTLVLRMDLKDDPSFRELVMRVRKRALQAYEYQDLPFEKLVEVINPPRVANYSPIVQAAFALRNIPIASETFPRLTINEFKFDSGISRFDLGLEVEETSTGLSFTIFYNQDLFDESAVNHMLGQYRDVLKEVILNPDQKLSTLSFSPFELPKESKPRSVLQADQQFFDQSNLTGTQLLTWAGQKLRPDDPIYNLAYIARIFTKIDPGHFQSALQELINTSDALRTTFAEEEGVPCRIVLPQMHYQMPVIDFSTQDQPEVALKDWIETQFYRQFNFAERLFDFALIKLSEEEWGWYLAIHHIIGDNWSVRLIFQRLQMLYESSLTGRLSEIHSFPQFEDYFKYEQSHRETPKFKASENYWINKFSRPVEPLSLYGNRFQKTETRSQRISFELGQERTKKLRDLIARDEFFTKSVEASLLNAFTTLFFAYFYRVSGNRDLALAISFHNRRTPEFRETIGLLMEALPLRVNIEDAETFKSLNKKVTSEAIETLQNRQYPLRNPIQSPIYEVVLNFHKTVFSHFLDAPVEFKRAHNNYDEDILGIHIRDYDESGSLKIDFDFNCAVFPPNLRKQLIRDYERILEAFLSDPDTQIDQVDMLSSKEQRKVLIDFNKTKRPFSEKKTISQLFEQQVLKTPDHFAVINENNELTYAQLNARANQLAHHLRSLGLQPDDLIGLYVERSFEMLVGMLGILKAGAAYLPLDPNLPNARLMFMLENSNTQIILTQRHLKKCLQKIEAQVFSLDDRKIFAKESVENPVGSAQSHNLAYVIYTSGSTGVPKGVMVEHRSLVNLSQWACEDWSLSPGDRVLQFTALSWDAHIEEIFPTLTSGATIILRTKSMIDTFQGFLESCQEQDITVLDLPTAYWHELTDAIAKDSLKLPPSLRLILIGGEKALKSRVESWLASVGREVRLLNDYGLTECTSIATQYDLRQNIPSDATEVPVGKPINNVQTYILNEHKKPVAIGIPSELWVGGNSLARGYLNNPRLTEECFVPNHLDQTPGDRLLKTGDLARRLQDGNLEILGRLDQQVKIRGYRIELGEIEAALNNHPSIQEAVVLALEKQGEISSPQVSEKRLAAYYIASQKSDHYFNNIDFQNFLKQKLPEYMIPSIFIALESFPLNPNGKVNRNALPHPGISDLTSEKVYLPPKTDLERQLATIWEEVLNVEPIGVMDNFFELGGHSLLAVRLFSLIERELSIKLPLVSFFESPTIANQAESILDQSSEEAPIVVGVETKGNKPPIFCVSPTIIDVMTYIELSKNLGADQPFYALYSPRLGKWREGTKQRKAIAKKLIEEILAIDPQGPYFIGGYSAGGVIALEIVQQMRKSNLEVDLLVLFDTFGPAPPKRLPWVTPWLFNALLVVRRIESYLWKFWILDWRGKVEYLRISKIRSWIRNRYGEVSVAQETDQASEKDPIYLGHSKYTPETYDGKVLLIRAKKGLLGIHPYPKLGWGKIFTGDFEICIVPGDHEAILFGPRSRYVAHKLNTFLDSASKSLR